MTDDNVFLAKKYESKASTRVQPGGERASGTQAPEPRNQTPTRFVLTRFADFMPLGGDDYCVKGLLPRSGLAVFWGPPKCGKSFLVFDLLMHVALGWEYRGHRVRQGPVVYVCLEGGRAFRRRREAFRRAKLKDNDDPPFYFVTNPLSLAADRKALIADIRRQMGTEIPVVVCIDTLNRSLAGSENSDEDMAAYIKAADAVRDAFDCLVVIVHHSPHDAQRPRGHSSLIGAVDVQIAVSRDAEDNVVAEIELAKDGETGLVFVSRLESVEIGRDTDDDPIASCVVREVIGERAARKGGGKGKRADDLANLKRAINDAYDRLADTVAKTSGFDGHPVMKVETDKLRDEVKRRGFLDTNDTGGLTGAARMLFLRTKTDFITSGRYVENDGLIWKITTRDTV